MCKQLLVVGCLLFTTQALMAQTEKSGTNIIGITDQAKIEEMMLVLEDIGTSSKELMREQSLKSYMMPNRKSPEANRNNAYVVASCLEFYVNFNSNFKVNLSPDFIAIQGGTTYKELLSNLVTIGTVNAAIFPYGSEYLNEAVNSTKRYEAENYLHIFRPDIGSRQKIFELRKALMRGNPVMLDIKVDNQFLNLINTGSWSYTGTGGTSIEPLIVTGYSEEKKAFEVTGAYGNKWGRDGYAWISYNDMGDLAENAYVLVVQR
jgi:hypothetical protein